MFDMTTITINSVIETKKPHPCGNYTWKVLRTGVDFKLECTKCNRQIMIKRIDLSKRIKKVVSV